MTNRQLRNGAASPAELSNEGGAEVIRLQDWLELSGATAAVDVAQPARFWIPGAQFLTCLLRAQLLFVANCSLVIESSPTVEGPWTSAVTFSAVGTSTVSLASGGGTSMFSNYVRWRVVPSGASWGICFQLKAFPSGGA
jgi:hypothetical protein